MLPDDINEIQESNEYNEEDINGENCASDEEEF